MSDINTWDANSVKDWSKSTNGTGGLISFTRGENPLRADKLNAAFAERVWREGDTMQGMLTLFADPILPLDAATKQYVQRVFSMAPGGDGSGGDGLFLPLSGGILTAPVHSTVPILTLLTSDNGTTCNNGLEVIQGYKGGGLAMNHNDTPHTASIRFGDLTFNDHNAMVFNYTPGHRGTGQFNNLESVLTIPAGNPSSQLTNAFTASVVDYGAHGALAGIFYAIAAVDNSVVYALNSVCTDRNATNHWATPLKNVREQIEFDYFVSDPSSTVRGVMVGLSASYTDYTQVPPVSGPLVPLSQQAWIGFETTLFPGSAPFTISYSSGNGCASCALSVGHTVDFHIPATPGALSQNISFAYTDNAPVTPPASATTRAFTMYADPTTAGIAGCDIRFNSSYNGSANLTLDCLSAVKSMNLAGDTSFSLVTMNGQNQLCLGDDVQTILIRGNNGGLSAIAAFNAIPGAINNVQFTGGVAGSPPVISSFHGQLGTDTNIGLNINAFGTGIITLGSPTRINGNIGFNTAPIAKPTADGAWAGNTAGKALSTALAALGLITDTSTA